MKNFQLITTKLIANPRLVWFLALLTLMALALAAGAPDGMPCANLPGC
jgi:hypothetical protein